LQAAIVMSTTSPTCRFTTAAISARLFGKYWYREPTETPARSAIWMVVTPSSPLASNT
jgi:hypothetical protein